MSKTSTSSHALSVFVSARSHSRSMRFLLALGVGVDAFVPPSPPLPSGTLDAKSREGETLVTFFNPREIPAPSPVSSL